MRRGAAERFEKTFNSPSVQLVTAKRNHFVLINSMALHGDFCNLCKEARKAIQNISGMLFKDKIYSSVHIKYLHYLHYSKYRLFGVVFQSRSWKMGRSIFSTNPQFTFDHPSLSQSHYISTYCFSLLPITLLHVIHYQFCNQCTKQPVGVGRYILRYNQFLLSTYFPIRIHEKMVTFRYSTMFTRQQMPRY